jgi:hypothetical protein
LGIVGRLARSRIRRALQALWIFIGLILMAVGLVGILLPTHLLGIFLVFGLILVLRNSRQWRKRFIRYQRRYPTSSITDTAVGPTERTACAWSPPG